MPFKDPEKRRKYHQAYMQRWYKKNKAKHIGYVKRCHERLRVKIDTIKAGQGCKHCPENDPRCLDFHHRDPKTKLFAIAEALRVGFSWATILVEIAKCDVTCANCHRKLHSRR